MINSSYSLTFTCGVHSITLMFYLNGIFRLLLRPNEDRNEVWSTKEEKSITFDNSFCIVQVDKSFRLVFNSQDLRISECAEHMFQICMHTVSLLSEILCVYSNMHAYAVIIISIAKFFPCVWKGRVDALAFSVAVELSFTHSICMWTSECQDVNVYVNTKVILK